MNADLDLYRNGNVISVKDMTSDLNINDDKWNFVFEYLLKQNNVVYFWGFRRWVDNDGLLDKILSDITEDLIVSTPQLVLASR